jgi:hypothetical protein
MNKYFEIPDDSIDGLMKPNLSAKQLQQISGQNFINCHV